MCGRSKDFSIWYGDHNFKELAAYDKLEDVMESIAIIGHTGCRSDNRANRLPFMWVTDLFCKRHGDQVAIDMKRN